MWLKTPRTTPKVMWVTPRMTDIFILKELRKLRWLTARLQTWGGGRDGCREGASPPESLPSARLPLQGLRTTRHPPDEGQQRGTVKSTDWAGQPGPQPQFFLAG